jgi:hypothetical protein
MPKPAPAIDCVKAWLAAWELPAPLRVRRVAGGFTSHVWRLESGTSNWVAKLAYQPPLDVENGLRAAAVLARTGLNTGPPIVTQDGELTRVVEYHTRRKRPSGGYREQAEPVDR